MAMADVGGRRVQRKKWSHVLFDPELRVVVYAISLCDYATPALEQPGRDRLHETLQLFQQTFGVESPLHGAGHFRIVLALTHADAFLAKHASVPFHTALPPDVTLLPDETRAFAGNDEVAMWAALPSVYQRWIKLKTGKVCEAICIDATNGDDCLRLVNQLRTRTSTHD
jgi:hypothetical protein